VDECVAWGSSQLKSALNTLQTLAKTISSKLLLCIGRSQMPNMLNERSLPGLKICEATGDFVQLSLDPILSGLESFQVFDEDVVDIFHGLVPIKAKESTPEGQ
jgi:hypothetical protein